MQVDSSLGPRPLVLAWRASGLRLAVAAGASVALLSLFGDTPVRIASLRGAIAWAAVLAVTSLGSAFAARAWQAPPVEPEAERDDGVAGDRSDSDAPVTR